MSWVPAKPKCDSCGVVKGETNHWWEVRVVGEKKQIIINPLKPHGTSTAVIHACSESCLVKVVSGELGKVKEP